jgi:hypothetical protein
MCNVIENLLHNKALQTKTAHCGRMGMTAWKETDKTKKC